MHFLPGGGGGGGGHSGTEGGGGGCTRVTYYVLLFIGCYNRSDRGKGKGISLFSISNPKKDLAARWLVI